MLRVLVYPNDGGETTGATELRVKDMAGLMEKATERAIRIEAVIVDTYRGEHLARSASGRAACQRHIIELRV